MMEGGEELSLMWIDFATCGGRATDAAEKF
jgi:hypothetical protein